MEQTFTVRLPGLVRHVLAEGEWAAEAAESLQALIDEMPHGVLRPLSEAGAPEAGLWRGYLAPYLGLTWLEAPWFFAEAYLFRRILEASGFFRPGSGQGVDPYTYQKRLGLKAVVEGLAPLLSMTDGLPLRRENLQETLIQLLTAGVWANQADQGMWPSGGGRQPGRPEAGGGESHLLTNHASIVADYLGRKAGPGRVACVLDNGGLELACDLVLADFLLRSRMAGAVHFYVRAYPTYVSDVIMADVFEMVAHLEGSPVTSEMGRRLRGYLAGGSLRLREHVFWNSPLAGWEMPPELHQELGRFDLLISKGDANYRRWLGDRHWDFTTPPEEVLNYLPAPWLALRIFKAELAIGLQPGQAEAMFRIDPQWLYDGRWAVIQFFDPKSRI
jgi:hypothetical protein